MKLFVNVGENVAANWWQESSLKVVNGEQLCEASPCYLLLRILDHFIRMGVAVSTGQL